MKNLLLPFLFLFQIACAQTQKPAAENSPETNSAQPSPSKTTTERTMISEELTNLTVKAAIDALQKGDRTGWAALFTDNAEFFDDGSPRDFKKFSAEAIGHERFTTIDKIENNGLDVFGHFHSDQWGDFKTYFKFHLNAAGKINRLDIGQANY